MSREPTRGQSTATGADQHRDESTDTRLPVSRRCLLCAGAGVAAGVTVPAATRTSAENRPRSSVSTTADVAGETEWQSSVPASVGTGPTVADGLVILGTVSGTVHAVDAESGQRAWTHDTELPVRATPTAADGVAYVGTGDPSDDNDRGAVVALQTTTGTARWSRQLDGPVASAVACDGETVYVGTAAGTLNALAADTGVTRWRVDVDETVTGTPVVTDGRLYVVDRSGVSALAPGDGERLWRVSLDDRFRPVNHDDAGSVTVADDTLYVVDGDGRVIAVDATTGERRWRTALSAAATTPTVANGRLLVPVTEDGRQHTVALDAETGDVVWRGPDGDRSLDSPTVAGGVVYAGRPTGLTALDGQTGEKRWQTDWWADTPVVVDGTAYVIEHSFDAEADRLRAVDTGHDASSCDSRVRLATGPGHDTPTGPTAGVTLDPTRPAVGEPTRFDATPSTGGAGLRGYEWSFDDGTNTTGVTTTHSFERPGTHSVRLSVTDADGDTDTVVESVDSGVRWARRLSLPVSSAPTVADGTVYVGGATETGGGVVAVDADSGQTVWHHPLDGYVAGAPTVAADTLYAAVGGETGKLVALDTDTGTPRWRLSTGLMRSAPTVVDGVVYAGSYDHTLYAVDAATGDVVWTITLEGYGLTAPTVVDDIVYVGSGRPGRLLAVDAADGTVEWATRTAGWVRSAPTVVDGVVYAGDDGGRLSAVTADTGVPVWQYDADDTVDTAVTVADGTVYAGSDDGRLHAVADEDGTPVWRHQTGAPVSAAPTVAADRVYVGTDESLHVVDAAAGTTVWELQTDATVHAAPTVTDGTVYTADEQGELYALAATHDGSSRGSRARHRTLGHAVSSSTGTRPTNTPTTAPATETPVGSAETSAESGETATRLPGVGVVTGVAALVGGIAHRLRRSD